MRIEYSAEEVVLAATRYQNVTGKTRADFMHWLGLIMAYPPKVQELYAFRLDTTARPYAVVRMEMILGPHWYTLLKAHEARQEVG